MISRCFSTIIVCAGMLFIAGCGGGPTGVSEPKNSAAESHTCITCHEDKLSPVTGQSIVTEWKASAHNTRNGAGCSDCHGVGYLHESSPASCSGCHTVNGMAVNPLNNPDASGKCADCHDSTKGFSVNRIYNGIARNTLTEHFSTPTLAVYTSGRYNARFVTKNFEQSCRSCHNPHDSSSQMEKFRQWARSGKGDVTAPPWTTYDFRTRGAVTPGATPANSFETDCVRCHTTTGHLNYLSNQSIAPFGASKTDGKEVLACKVCHSDYSYARRQVARVTAFYNKSTVSRMRIRIPVTYPDIGESNLCLNCHVGRETGQIIHELADPSLTKNKLIVPSGAYNFENASFENSHYLTAGATIFTTSGFEFYSSHYYDNPSFYGHDRVGVASYNNTGTSGPCITCHIKPGNHTFLPVAKDSSGQVTSLTSPACNNALCHNGNMTITEIEHQKEQFMAALDALKATLQEKIFIYFSTTNPYFFTKPYVSGYVENGTCSENQAVKNWQTYGTTTFTYSASSKSCLSATNAPGTSNSGPNNMGAAFNYNLLYHDFGAFAHNRFYAKRLIYDSISWLFDNNIKSTTNTQGYFSDVEAAIQNSTLLTAQQKQDACNYLFSSRSYTIYIPKDSRNWRPGSSLTEPVY